MIARLHALRERFDAVLIDLDGTLLDPHMRVSERTRQAVRHLVDSGFEVLLCTGRSVLGTQQAYRELDLDSAIVAFNGAWIGRPGAPPWRRATIPDGLVSALEVAERRARFSFRDTGDCKFTVAVDHPLHPRVAKWLSNVAIVSAPTELPTYDLMRISCYFDGDGAHEGAWRALDVGVREALLREDYPLSIFRDFEASDLHLLELMASGEGKAEAYAYLLDERGIPAHRTIAIGDQTNDLTMLRRAGLGVCMGNGVAAARAVADLVIGSNTEDGIAAWIEEGGPFPR